MTVMERAVAADGVAVVDAPQDLSAIHAPGCAAALWRRRPEPGFQAWLDALDPAALPKMRIILRPTKVRSACVEACAAAGTPDCAERRSLIDDAAALVDIVSGLMRAPFVRLRFDVVSTNACRMFHVDAITSRLVCTYRGTGTQYGVASSAGGDPRRIHTVAAGSPILLRGTLWPERPKSGLVHRSPPIEGTGETRLVLVIDPLTEIDGEV